MVLCMLEPGHAPCALNLLDSLAGIGLLPVESSTDAQGMQFGLRECLLGQFRACDAGVLEHQLRGDIEARFRRMRVEVVFRLFVQPLEAEDAPTLKVLGTGSR